MLIAMLMSVLMSMLMSMRVPIPIPLQACDEDVENLCLSVRPNMLKTPGAVGTCLASIVSDSCASQYARVPKPSSLPRSTCNP